VGRVGVGPLLERTDPGQSTPQRGGQAIHESRSSRSANTNPASQPQASQGKTYRRFTPSPTTGSPTCGRTPGSCGRPRLTSPWEIPVLAGERHVDFRGRVKLMVAHDLELQRMSLN
jgi:hypothetical protein